MIQLHQVGKHFGGVEVLPPTSLCVYAGECLCLTGPSGCGKTTLLEIAAGLIQSDGGGRVELGSERVACAFQDDVLIPWLDAQANITFALPGKARGHADTAHHWLQRFGLAPISMPPAMSGGMRRRLNLARAFASGPQVLFLDEPFAFLDPGWQTVLAALLHEALDKGTAILMVSHQLRVLEQSLPGLEYRYLEP
ncbi:MAG: ATP-binding cassette domain-containing protein [Proteobacteria bacterium]|nr:ATP-binding cassette domain-containing protein [Pseudomonadota bacterium]